MNSKRKVIFVTGTDTDVGKTVVSAGLCLTLPAHYWKPVQAGLPETDNAFIRRFIPARNIHPSAYTLKHPLSPNQAGQKENINITMASIKMPKTTSHLIIEGAGGALVPLNNKENMRDLMKKLKAPVIIVARSGLGTLNHTFLTLFALRARKIPILGVIMVGPRHKGNKRDIEKQGKVPVLLELPWLKTLSPQTLQDHFKPCFV